MREKERKKGIQLLLVGRDMLEAAIAIQGYVQINEIKSKDKIGKELIRLIQGMEAYGEAIIEDIMVKKRYKELLENTERNIEVCKVATVDIATLAANLAISTMKHISEIVESKALSYLSVAVAWGVDLIRKLISGAGASSIMDGTEIIIHKTKEAIDIVIKEIEYTVPAVLRDSEWKEVKLDIIVQSLFRKHTFNAEDEDEDFISGFSRLTEIVINKIRGLVERVHIMSDGV